MKYIVGILLLVLVNVNCFSQNDDIYNVTDDKYDELVTRLSSNARLAELSKNDLIRNIAVLSLMLHASAAGMANDSLDALAVKLNTLYGTSYTKPVYSYDASLNETDTMYMDSLSFDSGITWHNYILDSSAVIQICLDTVGNASVFTIYDPSDNTKIMDFDISSVTTGNTRTLTMSDYDFDLNDLFLEVSTFVGNSVAPNNSGSANTGMGYQSLNKNTTGQRNQGLGAQSLFNNTTGSFNSAFGFQSLYGTTGMAIEGNTMFGYQTGFSIQNGSTFNLAAGYHSLYSLTTGDNNVALGSRAGYSQQSGSRNIFIGDSAGYNWLGSDRGFIEVSSTNTPLIDLYFADDSARINGSLTLPSGNDLYIENISDADTNWVYVTGSGKIGSDSLADAGFPFEMETEDLETHFNDRKNGEIKWFYKENNKVKYDYSIKGSPNKVIQKLQSQDELQYIYIYKLHNEIMLLRQKTEEQDKLLVSLARDNKRLKRKVNRKCKK